MAAKKPVAKKETAKKPSLDIKDEMYWADKKNFNWLDQQDPDLAKTFSPLIAMKWFSVVRGSTDLVGYHIITANEYLNLNFWDMSKQPDLLWRLMCAQGIGMPQEHGWVPLASTTKKANSIEKLFLERNPHLNREEVKLLISKYDTDTFNQFLRDMGKPDPEIKELMKDFKKING